MKTTLTKFRVFVSLDKELAFINSMNQKGYRLTDVRFGVLFRFKKTQGEHFTILCGTEKEKIPELTSAAVSGGYTCAAHTFDAMGNFLYLDGERGKVNEDFFSDNCDKRTHLEQLEKFYKGSAISIGVVLAVLLLLTLTVHITIIPKLLQIREYFGEFPQKIQELLPQYFAATVILFLLIAFFFLFFATHYSLWRKTAKELTNLCSEMELFQ